MYELKSSKARFGRKIVNGAYSTLIERLASSTAPNLLLLRYAADLSRVIDLTAIPSRFLAPGTVEQRPALRPGTRRAGWVGSIIRLDMIPSLGRIDMVRSEQAMDRRRVVSQWKNTEFLEESDLAARGWLVCVLDCVERIRSQEFTLDDAYEFEERLRQLFPQNRNVRPKIRQQLQVLRDNGRIEFLGKGRYRKLK